MISIHTRQWEKLSQIVESASEELRQSFQKRRTVCYLKGDGSPLSDADLAIHDYLSATLPEVLAIPIISEDITKPVAISPLYWLIDPLDGTKEFLTGSSNFCINIALIEEGRPILGIIADPMAHQIYFARENEGAFERNSKFEWKRMHSRRPAEHTMITSRNHNSKLETRYQEEKKIKGREVMGSALKFIKLIKGESSLYPRFVPCCPWDVAAGHCLLREVGGDILNFTTGQSLTYEFPWNKNMAPFLATAFALENQELIHLRDFSFKSDYRNLRNEI